MTVFSQKIRCAGCFLMALAMAVTAAACKPQGRIEESGIDASWGIADGSEAGSAAEDGSGGGSSSSGKTANDGGTKTTSPVVTPSPGKSRWVKPAGTNFEVNTTAFPFIRGNHTIEVMVPGGDNVDLSKQGFAKEYEQKTGLKVKYKTYAPGDIFTVIAAMVQSGNLPDVFVSVDVGLTPQQTQSYGKQGLFADTAPYLAEWAPNLTARLNMPSNKGLKVITYSSDGKVFGLPGNMGVASGEENKESLFTPEHVLMVNKKWLDYLELSVPTTMQQLYEVAKAFREEDPDQNNKKDTYGFGINYLTPQLWNPWGLNMSWYVSSTIDEKGKIHSGPLTEQFREGARFYNRLWTEGIWNRNLVDWTTTKEEIQKTGIVCYPKLDVYLSDAELKDWIPIAWPKASNSGDFKAGANGGSGIGAWPNEFVISKKTKSIEACLRWLDYFYTLDGTMLWRYGPQGKAYSKVGDNYKLFKNAESLAQRQMLNDRIFPLQPGKILARNASELTAAEAFRKRVAGEYASAAKNLNAKYFANVADFFRTESEVSQLAALGNMGSMDWGYKAIRGEVNVDTDWNSYLNQYPKYGEWKAIAQKAVERMKAAVK